jgi:hypothetical protein
MIKVNLKTDKVVMNAWNNFLNYIFKEHKHNDTHIFYLILEQELKKFHITTSNVYNNYTENKYIMFETEESKIYFLLTWS